MMRFVRLLRIGNHSPFITLCLMCESSGPTPSESPLTCFDSSF